MNKEFEKRDLTKKTESLSDWYIDLILRAKLADYTPTKGCMVFRPYGFALWENIQKELGYRIEQAGVENAYFPLFIPYSLLKKEKEHIKGFSPELAVITHGGGKELTEPLVVRPTSETIMYSMFSKWIKSWRDLPLLINQWCNVVRWEKRTYLFLRTMEFLWQEGHTCHATEQEARKEVLRALKMYQDFVQDFLAIPVISGKKSESEKFPGANTTYAIEALMPDGKALQVGTSHELGQNFSKVFQVKFQDKDKKDKYVWQTSWGITSRMIGALIMSHGNDQGLILPPKIAPIQIVIIPIFEKDNKEKILEYSSKIREDLEKSGFKVKLDDREYYTPGWKFNEWELKGVPLRIEIGKKEVKYHTITLVRRDIGGGIKIQDAECKIEIEKALEEIQENLYRKAKESLGKNTYNVDNYDEFKRIMRESRGFIYAPWCGSPVCEKKIKEETKATTRVLPLGAKEKNKKCIYCSKKAKYYWLFAQAY